MLLDPSGGRAKVLGEYRSGRRVYRSDRLKHRAFAQRSDKDEDREKEDDDDLGDDDGDSDGLEREYGSDAADTIRHHLATFRARVNSAKDVDAVGAGEERKLVYSPLDEIEERFRTIDRWTAAPGSTQDLALWRRAQTKS